MSRSQLLACCKLLEISALGPTGLLRHRLRVRLRELEADDLMILNEGVESLTIWELQSACRERGMRSTGVSELRLRSQLHDWLTLNIRDKMPTTLLLLSRAMYVSSSFSFTLISFSRKTYLEHYNVLETKLTFLSR